MFMSTNRRTFFTRLTALSGGLVGLSRIARANPGPVIEPAAPAATFETPDAGKLPWTFVNGRKEFHLVAEVLRREFIPGKTMDVWGYNGCVPGPCIEAQEGDRLRIVVDNHLPERTSMHWHGLEIPVGMDGVPGVSQDPIPPGGRFTYEFDLHQNGTFFYHSHMSMQEMMGMIGFFIVHPQTPHAPKVDKDFGLILQEWAVLPNNTIPNTLAMEYNWLTFNGKSGPATTPLIARLGDRVRLRLVNLGMDHHPIHLHGNTFVVTGSEAGRMPESTWAPGNTVLVGVGQARDIEFDAKYAGDWMVHCHMPHHGMNQMASMVGPMMHMGHGVQTGAGMQEGMGMMRQGGALSEEAGPSLGRGLGAVADEDRQMSNMHSMDDPEKKKVPGYPQDMWMVMDEDYAHKPECYGLRPGWSGGMMGMMTLIRVVPPDLYDKIQELRGKKPEAPMEGHQHHHEAH
jgi:FtsP/CotA-like multicopper oxidase with cupredoxin domain